MKLRSSILATAGAFAAAATMTTAFTDTAMAQSTVTPREGSIPIDVWALRDVVNAVQISPDGRYILVHKTESANGKYLLEIYDANDMSKPFRRLNADPMEIIGASWVSDNYIFGTAWEQNRKTVKGPEESTYDYASFAYDLKKNKFTKVDGSFSVVNTLPDDPDSILISDSNSITDTTGVDPYEAFRPRSYYKYNLSRGTRELVLKGNQKFPTAQFDNQGNPRFATSLERGTNKLQTFYRAPSDSNWKQFGEEYDFDEHENLYRVLGGFMGPVGFKQGDPNIGYIIDNRGEDKAALYEFDFRTGQFGEKLVQTNIADIIGVQTSSMPGDDTLVAAYYPGAKMERVWFDEQEKALYDALEAQIPNAHQLRISSRSRDGKSMIVQNSGPHDPGSFWLVRNGTLSKLGSRNPLIKPEQLADVKFIRYPARDGKMIPGYVTMPKGEGPFPLIVLPHGGPHVNEVIGYDEWGQFLANNGYMVLQPQYRMSVGWGQDHFDSAYGQHGLAMQDDKDDGAKYLAEQGLADPDRMAMFGWSYGGYAALVAASRSPNIYQCAIAGAAVADPAKVYRLRSSAYDPKALDEWSKRRGMIGINPINEVAKNNIPLLMIHGDVDSRVLYFNYEDYKKAMDAAGQKAQYLTLEGADHFYVTLMNNHQKQLYTTMLSFLQNDCGPGGL